MRDTVRDGGETTVKEAVRDTVCETQWESKWKTTVKEAVRDTVCETPWETMWKTTVKEAVRDTVRDGGSQSGRQR
jgi:hypothetical protein